MFHWKAGSFILLTVIWIAEVESDYVVNPPCGSIRGISVSTSVQKEVYAFYGIPYAKNPVENLRFSAPVEIEPWTNHGEFDATRPSRPCYGRSIAGMEQESNATENCLKLHIWVPKSPIQNSTVMVYIHGGGFIAGDPLFEPTRGSILAAEENIIVVSMNYRLDVQGFLSLKTPGAPGNVGLLDQQMALKWVKNNIAGFGGNPNDVTIFGMSAGGASVGFHVLTPSSGGLFRRAIVMSGVPNSPWAFKNIRDNVENSLDFSSYMGCRSKEYSKIVSCLELIHPSSFLRWREHEFSSEDIALVAPTNDGGFLQDDPKTILENHRFNNVDLMIGNTADEGSMLMVLEYPEMKNFQDGALPIEHFQKILNSIFKKHSESFRMNIASMYKQLYTNGTRPDSEDPIVLRDRMKDIFSDYLFNCPSQEFADLYSKDTKNRVYRYVVKHAKSLFEQPGWMGSAHGSDTILHLGAASSGPPTFTEDDAVLSKQVMKWWANFARTGNPNPEKENFGQWPVSTISEQEYLQIGVQSEIKKKFRAVECSMLKNIVEKFA